MRWGMIVRCPEPCSDLRIPSEAVEDARCEGVGGDHPTGNQAIQSSLDGELVAPDPPVRNSPRSVHGGLVFEQEEDDLPGEGIRANCGINQGFHNFPQPNLLTTKTPRTPYSQFKEDIKIGPRLRSSAQPCLPEFLSAKTPRTSFVIESVESVESQASWPRRRYPAPGSLITVSPVPRISDARANRRNGEPASRRC